MKYLNRREDFLNKSKYTKIENLIKEEAGTRSGPFENDIPWGDSLLGRLIMATIRKASIGINIMSIKRLIPRLNEQFNEILESCKISEDSKKDIARVTIFALLKELKDAVDAGKEIDILISLTDETISNVNKADIEEDKKNKLLQELEEWKKFLLEFKDGTGTESEVTTPEQNTPGSLYPLMIKNLKALALILSNYKKVQLGVTLNTSPKSKSIEVVINKEYLYDGKVVKVTKIEEPNVFIIFKDVATKTYKPNSVPQSVPKIKLTLMTESEVFRFNDFVNYLTEAQYKNPATPEVRVNPLGNKPGANIDRNNVVGTEDHLTQAYSKLKKDIEVLISPKEKGIGVDSVFINDIITKSVDSKNKEIIKDLYKEINRYLIGDKKVTIQAKDPLFKESIEILTDKRKLTIVAEKIARFIKRALQFDGQNLYGGLGDLKVPLQDFVTTTKQLSKPVSTKEVTDDDKSLETSKPDDSRVQKIKDYFYEKVDYEAFVVDKTEIDKIEGNLKNVQDDKLTLSIDPIMEILKLFNRAYKLHTTNVIPGGRSGGAVSRSVYNEYTPLGSNSGGVSGTADGPYRNNKTFNIWEDAVLDIMKQRKYQPIFSKDTEILIGGKLVKGAGSTFKKLITNLLDGDKLYKEGAQKKFLNEYFGPDAVPEGAKLSIGNDEKVNADNAGDVKEVELSFIKNSDLTTNEDIKNNKFTNKILQLKGKEGDKDRTIYIFVEGIASGYLNISYCTSIYFFKKYIDGQGSATLKTLNTMVSAKTGPDGDYLLRYSKVELKDFIKILKNSKVELNSVTTGGTIQKGRVIQPTLVSWLGNDTDKSLYSITDTDRLVGTKSSVGGSRNVGELVSKKYGEENDFTPISKVVE